MERGDTISFHLTIYHKSWFKVLMIESKIYVCSKRTIIVDPKIIYDKCDDFDFDIEFFRFWMVMFLVVLLVVDTFRILLGLQESATILRTSTRDTNALQPKFSSRAIGIINLEKYFLNFIADTMN